MYYCNVTWTDSSLQQSIGNPLTLIVPRLCIPSPHSPQNRRCIHTPQQSKAINSSVPAKDKETKHFRQALIPNGYPKDVIQRHSRPTRPGPANQQDAWCPSVTLPYVRGVSEAVRCILTPLGLRVSFHPNTTLRHLLVRPNLRITSL